MTAVHAIDPERIEDLLEQVPAEVRAKVRWGGRAAMRDLVSNPPSDHALAAVARAYVEALAVIFAHVKVTALTHEAFEDTMPELFDDLAKLRKAFSDTRANSAIEWATASLELFFRATFGGNEAPRVAEPVSSALEGPAVRMLGAFILVLALSIALSSGRPADELLEHAEWAYLEAEAASRALEGTPLACTPFQALGPRERSERVLRYASELRASMDVETADAIESARVRKLF